MKYKDEDPDNLGGLGDMLPAEVLKMLKELQERTHQPDHQNNGSNNTFIYVAPGAQYVKNLYQLPPLPEPPQRKTTDATGNSTDPSFDEDTPLSALFLESHHGELRQIIESWRPYLINDDPAIDALSMSRLEFDFDKVIATHIYIDIGRLLHDHALKDDNMSLLAKYLFQHTNLSNSQSTLYVQLRKYKKR